MKAVSPQYPLLRGIMLMSVKQALLGTKKKGKFSGAPESNVQVQLESHQRAATPSYSNKQSEDP